MEKCFKAMRQGNASRQCVKAMRQGNASRQCVKAMRQAPPQRPRPPAALRSVGEGESESESERSSERARERETLDSLPGGSQGWSRKVNL
jgi:hypothetical protein